MSMKRGLTYRSRGFTLIELLVTLALMGLLVSAAASMSQLNAKRQKEQQLRRALWEIRDAIDAYKQASDDGRIEKAVDESGYPKSLNVLVAGVENQLDPNKKRMIFLRRIPRDPFSELMSDQNEVTWKIHGYDGSEGEGSQDVYDVTSTSHLIGINGQPYSEW